MSDIVLHAKTKVKLSKFLLHYYQLFRIKLRREMTMDLNPVMIVLLIKFLLIFVLSNYRLNESSPLCYRIKKKKKKKKIQSEILHC